MNPIGVPIPFPDDAMPPEGQYSSREELVTAINAWAAPRGYAFSVKSSVVTPSGRTRVIYSCDRGAGKAPKVKPANERKRKTTTRRTGCQFSIAAKESLCKTVWSLTHRPGPGFDRHNHEPSFSERAHPVHRHLSSPDRSTVHKLSNAGIEPRKIQSYLHLNSDTLATQQDIYNYIAQDRCLACMNALSSPSCFPGSPVLLCLWHINNAVTSYCKPGFTRDKDDVQGQEKWDTFYKHWHGIVASTTEDIYMERLEKFKQQYSPDHLNEVGYIIETWLELYKERFVKAWVHQHCHFQQFVTSRAEGIHRLIKSHMKTSQVDLFGAWNIIKLVLSNQLKRLEEVQSQQQASTPIDISGPLYSNIRGWLSHEALRQLDNQRQRLLREYPACTGVTARTLGLPCAHMLQPLIQLDEPLLLEQIHPHWLLHRPGTPRIIIEPHKLFNRLAASSKLPPTSTQREPCAFEAIEKETSQKAPPKCSKCGTVGHTSRSKVCALRYDYLVEAPIRAFTTTNTVQAPNDSSTTTHTITHTTTRSITRSASPASLSGVSMISETIAVITTHTTAHTTTCRVSPPAPTPLAAAPALRADDPRAIYQRYKEAREAWYATVPRGGLRTNQQYRKAMGLPARYSKIELQWCLNYKQMGSRCREKSGTREWTKEEQFSYLDWDKAENERVEQNVGEEMAEKPFPQRRGMQHIWDAAERDVLQQGGGA
uniref:Transposon MULE transposase n=1 Tax=Fusarium oxysporum f. sp. vasinfectum TaxID=61374 RepID=A0A482NR80_FUSOX|nr:transposon MULE transposase [Fusarium oxysporum f. sp. vasinfectum]QBR95892.1 transposon MULE transposase [Fusarium oxysporum f. sp. vasinfectum]QBR95894.1 transposon MULE transposase [Fusarium oxysporum f. sp. vasinfectum]QBR95896.1 transposon MULE transposase [Fusarium oxysporum f. sp. vasinfectum]QBR95898.1 transposon MULE transposase [Fusarium oxysporum f. sp. vasinfectum]